MSHWFKGNTHAHTTNSDGDASPDAVVAWYEEHGYHFLALSDHNVLTPPAVGRPTSLTLLSAEEVTMPLWVHVNGLGLHSAIEPPVAPEALAMADQKPWFVEQALAAIEAQGALAHVNHPNFLWALNAELLERIPGVRFLEVFNGHHASNNLGDSYRPSVESLWDRLLQRGRLVYGVASDDAHHYATFDPIHDNPGRGWIWVRTEDARPESILAAMRAGDFYASTGVTLAECDVRGRELCVTVAGEAPATIELLGTGGKVLDQRCGLEARFALPSSEPYVRARVSGPHGQRAWLQPVWQARS
ncbi:MAG: PHP domain-containing protein [Chloroflexota bacterium]|nr:PHP domain-containing protein [Chloroflexota bacterium]